MVNRCVDIVVGMQAGSEGKGKLITVLTDIPYKALVRTGSTNASHGVVYKGKKFFFHQLPCSALHFPDAKLVLGANAQIDHEYLEREIQWLKDAGCWFDKSGRPRLVIDPNATIIETIDKVAENGGRMPSCGEKYFHPRDCEQHTKLGNTCAGCPELPKDSAWLKLGSTTHGGGVNAARKIARSTKMVVPNGTPLNLMTWMQARVPDIGTYSYDEIARWLLREIQKGPITDWGLGLSGTPIKYASDDAVTQRYLGDTVDLLNRYIDRNEAVMLEGTQGALLSLHFGPQGKTTSRDTNASNWCAEAGISPFAVRDVYGVVRTFPIRVASDSGPMPGVEITWKEVTEFAGATTPIVELTSATKRERRVSTFGEETFRRAVDLNRPTKLMLTFADYISASDYGKSEWSDLTQKTRDWITVLESKMGVFFKYVSTGPDVEHTVTRLSPGEMLATAQMRGQI